MLASRIVDLRRGCVRGLDEESAGSDGGVEHHLAEARVDLLDHEANHRARV